ncbi:UNVERIFIED_CONTAM: hypothetical protein FKN15_054542 [Acipenser sinensis]
MERLLPSLNNEESSGLDTPLVFPELTAAVTQLSKGKAPGLDGLPAEFYKRLVRFLGKLGNILWLSRLDIRCAFGLERNTAERKAMCCLRLPGGREVSSQAELRRVAVSFYIDLYTDEGCDPGEMEQLLQRLPSLDKEESSGIDTPLVFPELTAAVTQLSKGKAPGLDGLPAEFYKRLVRFLGKVLSRPLSVWHSPSSSAGFWRQNKLKDLVDTKWRAHLGVPDNEAPVWRVLYKLPLPKRSRDLQWRVLHGIFFPQTST